MSYTPTTWADGDVITATKLNKIEQGIADSGGGSGTGALIINYIYDDDLGWCLDKSVGEIYEAYLNKTPIYIYYEYGNLGYDNFTSWQFLMPIVGLHNYAYGDVVKIIATRPKRILLDNTVYSYTPAVMIFEASFDKTEQDAYEVYPTYYKTIYTGQSYSSSTDGTDA